MSTEKRGTLDSALDPGPKEPRKAQGISRKDWHTASYGTRSRLRELPVKLLPNKGFRSESPAYGSRTTSLPASGRQKLGHSIVEEGAEAAWSALLLVLHCRLPGIWTSKHILMNGIVQDSLPSSCLCHEWWPPCVLVRFLLLFLHR